MTTHIAVWGQDAAGIMSGPVVWMGTATVTSGAWSVDYTDAGFLDAPIVVATPVLNASNVYDRAFASLSGTPTTTGAAGYAVRGANLIAVGATTRIVPDGTVIHVIAIGETSHED